MVGFLCGKFYAFTPDPRRLAELGEAVVGAIMLLALRQF